MVEAEQTMSSRPSHGEKQRQATVLQTLARLIGRLMLYEASGLRSL
jgi:hypothetical protein